MSSKKFFSKATEPIDHWLESQGLYRKHTAHEPSCLFRAVAEQVYFSQCCHSIVRKQCVEYLKEHKLKYEKLLESPFEDYVANLESPKEWGTSLELDAISLLYQREIIIFEQGEKPSRTAIHSNYSTSIMLCASSENHYDSVYPKVFIMKAAFCQSLVYEIVYKNVFKLLDVDIAVDRMLHKSNHNKKAHYLHHGYICPQKSLGFTVDIPIKSVCHSDSDRYEGELNVRELLSRGITPFPYKVAKALDPDIYRNIEFDVWCDVRREIKLGVFGQSSDELQIGVKCLVKFQPDQVFHAHIQEMEPNKGPVMVYVEELGKKCTVSHDALEPLPKSSRVQWALPFRQQRHLAAMSPTSPLLALSDINKWKGSKYSKLRKVKDAHMPVEGTVSHNAGSGQQASFEQEKSLGQMSYRDYRVNNFRYSNMNVTNTEVRSDSSGHMIDSEGPLNKVLTSQADSTTSPRPGSPACEAELPESSNACMPPTQVLGASSYPFCPNTNMIQSLPIAPPVSSYLFCNNNPANGVQSVTSPMEGFTMQPVNFYAQKSVQLNGSDLPFSDIPTLQFYYNLGHDFFRSGYMMWSTSGPSSTPPPCVDNSQLLPDSTVSSEEDNYQQNSSQQMQTPHHSMHITMQPSLYPQVHSPVHLPMQSSVYSAAHHLMHSSASRPQNSSGHSPAQAPVHFPGQSSSVCSPAMPCGLQSPQGMEQSTVQIVPASAPQHMTTTSGIWHSAQGQSEESPNKRNSFTEGDIPRGPLPNSQAEESHGIKLNDVGTSCQPIQTLNTAAGPFGHSSFIPYYMVGMDSVPVYSQSPCPYVIHPSAEMDASQTNSKPVSSSYQLPVSLPHSSVSYWVAQHMSCN